MSTKKDVFDDDYEEELGELDIERSDGEELLPDVSKYDALTEDPDKLIRFTMGWKLQQIATKAPINKDTLALVESVGKDALALKKLQIDADGNQNTKDMLELFEEQHRLEMELAKRSDVPREKDVTPKVAPVISDAVLPSKKVPEGIKTIGHDPVSYEQVMATDLRAKEDDDE